METYNKGKRNVIVAAMAVEAEDNYLTFEGEAESELQDWLASFFQLPKQKKEAKQLACKPDRSFHNFRVSKYVA